MFGLKPSWNFSISILPLREEWDPGGIDEPHNAQISILPLREEWDLIDSLQKLEFIYFNPPTPRGVGPFPLS